jgi:hypothetical protein
MLPSLNFALFFLDRTMLLKGALLGILVSFWFRRLPGSVDVST